MMNGIENIINRIGADAEQEAAAIHANAAQQAEAIRADFRAKAEAEAAAILARGRMQAEAKEERLVNAARLEARKQTLAAKQEMVDQAFSRAMEQLAALPSDDYIDLLARLAARASATGREQVLFSEQDRARVGKQVVEKANALLRGGGLTLSAETRSMTGGVVLKDDKIETNCSFEVLLQLKRDDLVTEVAGVLFG